MSVLLSSNVRGSTSLYPSWSQLHVRDFRRGENVNPLSFRLMTDMNVSLLSCHYTLHLDKYLSLIEFLLHINAVSCEFLNVIQ